MTEWRTPGDEVGATGAAPSEPPPAPPPGSSRSGSPRAGRRQRVLLAVAAVIIAATAVLALVVDLRGSDGPAAGSPDAVADDFAAALQSGSAERVAGLACAPARARVLQAARPALGDVARRAGSASAQGDVAVARLQLAPAGGRPSADPSVVGTLGLQQLEGAWCVQAFVAAAPVSGPSR